MAGFDGCCVVFFGSSLWNMLDRARMCESVAGGGRRLSVRLERRAAVRLLATAMMIWSHVAIGILKLRGNHLTVSQMWVDSDEVLQILWQWKWFMAGPV